MLKVSDEFKAYVCNLCGQLALANPDQGIFSCKLCKRRDKIQTITIPYSCKQLIEELTAVHIKVRIGLHKDDRL